MTDWLDTVRTLGWQWQLVGAAAAGLAILLVGNRLLKAATWGSPRALVETSQLYVRLRALPPATLFRWRVGVGLQVVVYDEATDEEKEMPSGLRPDRAGPGLAFWMWGERPRSAAFVAARVRRDFLVRLVCFFWFFLGGFVVLVRLAITESPLWLVALVFLLVHQLATSATGRYILFEQPRHAVLLAVAAFLFLRGGVLATVAVYALGAYFVLYVLGFWYMVSSGRMERLAVLRDAL
ncbi:hypothetical protein [Actinophytocola xanthii]|uniref:Uncharacterized protein n=1 Tax=Actinophytocola xanthii TaxID=1912961 RepID=A0A1Q8CKB7_9PSEU|nr:hypothetical protein [Actinophytocola xanthii]OLF14779.1 hypothetical protein BU204_25585 [Actinophytocola xanthii]